MRNLVIFLAACTLAAVISFLPKHIYFQTDKIPFPGWSPHFEGKPLKKLQLSEREKYFNNGFPGDIAKLTDGKKVLVIRWVTRATRKLHPARDCFKGVGYQVRVLSQRADNEGQGWSSRFEAIKNGEKALVLERIFDNKY